MDFYYTLNRSYTIPPSCGIQITLPMVGDKFIRNVNVYFMLVDTSNPNNIYEITGEQTNKISKPSEYTVDTNGYYTFHPLDIGREVMIRCTYVATSQIRTYSVAENGDKTKKFIPSEVSSKPKPKIPENKRIRLVEWDDD